MARIRRRTAERCAWAVGLLAFRCAIGGLGLAMTLRRAFDAMDRACASFDFCFSSFIVPGDYFVRPLPGALLLAGCRRLADLRACGGLGRVPRIASRSAQRVPRRNRRRIRSRRDGCPDHHERAGAVVPAATGRRVFRLGTRHAVAASARSGARVSELSTNYFRGLNYLLNEQQDKAIEVFLKLAEINRDTVETHLALGNLFRRRGEVDRAIRVHQHLIARPNLNEAEKTVALLELGEDYMRAGLLDRAETLFTDLVAMDAHGALGAASHLIAIYQHERDWDKAIDHARRLEESAANRKVP